MKHTDVIRGYRGGYLIGFILIGVVAIRDVISFQYTTNLAVLIPLLGVYTLHYLLEPWLVNRFTAYRFFYLLLQTSIVVALSTLRPFIDITCLLYVPLSIQILRGSSHTAARIWITLYVSLLAITLILGWGWQAGLALVLLFIAMCAFIASYDFLYYRTQTDQARSQQLLTDLQSAHRKLQDYAAQAEELAAARERNRLARELHDSISQAIFSIRLTSQSARILLEREPAHVPEQLDRLQKMTGDALTQLRSLISQLRPHNPTC